jgi:hypothetical protein
MATVWGTGISQEDEHQNLAIHDHVNLHLLINGKERALPALIGINPGFGLWKNHSLDMYGESPNTLSPMHTHDFSGLIHIEPVIFREFDFGNFLDLWGVDKSKITSVTVNGKETVEYEEHPLRNGDNLTLKLNTATSLGNFTQISDSESRLTTQYPSSWRINKTSVPPADFRSALGEKFLNKFYFIPPESEYLLSPQLSVQTDELPRDNITLDEYTIARLPKEVEGDSIRTPHLNESISLDLNGNPARKIILYTEHFYPLSDSYLPYLEKTMKIWTIRDDKVYTITYSVMPESPFSSYPDYYPVVEKMLESIRMNQ